MSRVHFFSRTSLVELCGYSNCGHSVRQINCLANQANFTVHYGRVMFVNELAVVQALMLALVLTVLSVDWPVLARCETSALICGLIAGA